MRTAFENQCDQLDKKIEAMTEWEKKFYLWNLLRFYYKPSLIADKKKYSDNNTTVSQINRLIDNVNEIDTLLCYDLF